MPFNKTFPLADLKESLLYFYKKTQRRVTYEYVVWEGINDTEKDVKALVQFCKIVPCKVNLIEYNPIGDDAYRQASDYSMNLYKDALIKNGIIVNIRRSRGSDIDATCGQLANKESLLATVSQRKLKDSYAYSWGPAHNCPAKENA